MDCFFGFKRTGTPNDRGKVDWNIMCSTSLMTWFRFRANYVIWMGLITSIMTSAWLFYVLELLSWKIQEASASQLQSLETDLAPRGAYRGRAPTEINRLGATGVQIEAEIFVIYMTLLGWRPFFPFFLEITCFGPEKQFEFLISDGKSLLIFGLHLVHLIQTGMNFSCPRAPFEFT